MGWGRIKNVTEAVGSVGLGENQGLKGRPQCQHRLWRHELEGQRPQTKEPHKAEPSQKLPWDPHAKAMLPGRDFSAETVARRGGDSGVWSPGDILGYLDLPVQGLPTASLSSLWRSSCHLLYFKLSCHKLFTLCTYNAIKLLNYTPLV